MKRRGVIVVVLLSGFVAWWFLAHRGQGTLRPADFDPVAIAASETRMWQAYYRGDRQTLGIELMKLLAGQFDLSVVQATRVAGELAGATFRFREAAGGYEELVLPGLENAYRLLADATAAAWDYRAAARAELEWWVARRTPGQSDPANVGREIAELYSILYGSMNENILTAGRLRAEAADLRDRGGAGADWQTIQAMLEQSYTALLNGTR